MPLFHYVVRLRRGGHKGHPVYHIIYTFKYRRSRSIYLHKLGFLDLTKKHHVLFVNLHLLGSVLNRGAIINAAVRKYISKFVH